MLLGKKKYSKLNLMELFSDELLQYTLEGLDWQKGIVGGKHFEQIKFKSITNSKLTEILLATLFENRIKLGDFIYSRVGNRLERFDVTIPTDKPKKEAYSVSKPFTVDVDLSKKRVVKIE